MSVRLNKLGDNLAFIALRDAAGKAQLVIRDQDLCKEMGELTPESVVYARGTVQSRPEEDVKHVSQEQPSGSVEVEVSDVRILNAAESPLPLRTYRNEMHACLKSPKKPNEDLRLTYRYLDLRRPVLQSNIRRRAQAMKTVRETLDEQDFVEVDTPLLFKSTPEGAREFLVPTRTKDRFYALPQSPQQVTPDMRRIGMSSRHRYYQIARCFRDEDGRSDRQPEFTQVDIELSFTNPAQIQSLIERIMYNVYRRVLGIDLRSKYPEGFPHMPYQQAMAVYGSDKPDLRFGLKIVDVTQCFPATAATHAVEVLHIPGASNFLSRAEIDNIEADLKAAALKNVNSDRPTHDVAAVKLSDKNRDTWFQRIPWLGAPCHLSSEHLYRCISQDGCALGDLVLIVKRPSALVGGSTALGRSRLLVAKRLQDKGALTFDTDTPHFLWVDSFPLFTPAAEDADKPAHALGHTQGGQQWAATHHPFTAPHPDDYDHLASDPARVRGLHYDLVLDGHEIAGGSIRIHQHALQMFVFRNILGMCDLQISRFKHLTDALKYGCPPHGGIAIGFDRLLAVMFGASSIRDVIPFPKSAGGAELMVGSPSSVTPEQRQEYHI
ncbi:aspartate--tRNA ligase msd1 [Sorochytrium milnesiophthora]